MKRILILGSCLFFVSGVVLANEPETPDDQLETPAHMWKRREKTMVPFNVTIQKDEIVQSDSRPELKLRRVEVKFYSLELENGRKWGHPCVVLMPADEKRFMSGQRRGKCVIVGQRSWDGLATGPWRGSFLGNYGEPIAAETGYPTMILPHPGEYDGENGREISIGFLRDRLKSNDVMDHPHFVLASIYVRALDVMAEVLNVERQEIRAVIGGHSKRATCAHTAATIDPRIRGVVYMGNESAWEDRHMVSRYRAVYPPFAHGRWTDAKCIYLGATNEDGYTMFNVNLILNRMNPPWALAYVPNYRHASQSEKHFIVWKMWIKHVFDGRPITQISELSYENKGPDFEWGGRNYGAGGGTLFKCKINTPNKIIQAKVWYVYNDDVPYWRDLVWYPEFMIPLQDDYWAGYVKGKMPDAWIVEVKDIADGFPGYICSLPQDITHLPRERKKSRGSRSRLWESREGVTK